MRIIEPSAVLLDVLNGSDILKRIETCGRISYKSECFISNDSASDFVKTLIKNGHTSVIEHVSFSVKFVVDRGVSHEIVRHRLSSFTQESTRYCNYSKGKFNNEVTFIRPLFYALNTDMYRAWERAMSFAESQYLWLCKYGSTPQEARSVLPNSLKTEIIMTENLRSWRNFFMQRTSKTAHPQMRQVTVPLLNIIKQQLPIIFDDIQPYEVLDNLQQS